ncbi:transketolase [Pseudomonas entomophila]|uniref:transketolase n=1 Tax=Pseudomonas entomophila TaxID=312306 RepID=UPI0023D8BF07|nr:transketolase [Pseudomonas entomophila]MDF0730104.1 transketolase [Pseudomonas entomophila]
MKTPSQEAAVVIVSSAALGAEVSDGLARAIADWNEVAHLHVQDMDALQANWLAAERGQPHTDCQASALLRAVSKRCYLLDLESEGAVRLAWLGSVCGHELHCLQLTPGLAAEEGAQAQVQRVVEVARTLVRTVLAERFAP